MTDTSSEEQGTSPLVLRKGPCVVKEQYRLPPQRDIPPPSLQWELCFLALSTQGGTLVLKELRAVVFLPCCHPVCDPQHYTVMNTQLSFLKKTHLVGREPVGGGTAAGHSALGAGSLYTPTVEAPPPSSTVSSEPSGLENYHLLP